MDEPTKTHVSGNNNLTAGGNIVINPNSLIQSLSEYFKEIDHRINSVLPKKILSPTRNNRDETFSSEKMIRSLLRVGLPVEATFVLLDILPSFLQTVVLNEELITTHHLRIAVIKAIHNIDGQYTNAQRETWGDRYSRRYGVPDHRIRVLEKSGDYLLFDFRYIEKEILPEMFFRLTGIEGVEPESIATSQDIDQMKFDIFEGIRSLHLYLVPFSTVLNVVEALAMQPPHPWFVTVETRERTVRYDRNRIEHHELIITSNNTTELEKWNSVSECITHSCSSVLAHYGAYIGSTKYAALNSLAGILDILENGEELTLWTDNQIQSLPSDLKGCGFSVPEFLAILNKAKKQARWHCTSQSMASLSKTAIQIKDIATAVLNSKVELNEIIKKLTENTNNLTENEFRTACFALLKYLPDSTVKSVLTNSKLKWLKHTSKTTVMQEIRSHILIFPCAITAPLNNDEIETKRNLIANAVQSRPVNVNSIVLVVEGTSINNFMNIATELQLNGCQIVIKSVRDLCDLVSSNQDPIALESFVLQ